MISFLRNRLQGIVAFSFLGVVALTFAFLGLPTFTQAVTDNDYATIDEYTISQSEYFSVRSSIQDILRDNNEEMSAEDLEAEINNQLIDKYTKIHFINEIGIIVPDSFAENELSRDPLFQDNGEFSNDIFKNYLVNNNLSKYDLLNVIKEVYDKKIVIHKDSKLKINRCLRGQVEVPTIKKQLQQLKEFYG